MKSSNVNVDDVIVFEDAAIDLKILWDFTPLEVYADVDEDRITFLKTIG